MKGKSCLILLAALLMSSCSGVKEGQIGKAELSASLEMAKIFYRDKNWPLFFGEAKKFNLYFLEKVKPGPDHETFLALEALALTKKCQWEKAQDSVANLVAISKNKAFVDKTISYVALAERTGTTSKKEQNEREKKIIESGKFWKAKRMPLSPPKSGTIAVIVEDRCQSYAL